MKALAPALHILITLLAILSANPADASQPVILLEKTRLKADGKYEWNALRLKTKLSGEFRLWHRGPVDSDEPLPVIFLLAGIESNQSSLDLIGDVNAHIFSLDYNIPVGATIEDTLSAISMRYLEFQVEILAAFFWFFQNPDLYDFSRLSSVNISFGTFIAPLALRVASRLEVYPKATIFAFGGADIKNFVMPFLATIEDEKARERAEELLPKIFDPIDPGRHLKHLQGPFLVIRAAEDEIIPEASSLALENGLRGEKEVLRLQTPHIDVDQPEAIRQLRESTLRFLIQNEAL